MKKTGGNTLGKVLKKNKKSATRSFGSSRRENHNSDPFYHSRLYAHVSKSGKTLKKKDFIENVIPQSVTNKIYCQSSESMEQLPDSSVHLMITSPPYNASKTYDEDRTLQEYRLLLRKVFEGTWRVLVTGGRACINVANLGRSPYIPLHAILIEEMLSIGFLMRGEIIWNKGTSAGISTAWGSWKSPSNPALRDTHEYILIFSKASFSRPRNEENATISKEEFVCYTKSMWDFRTISALKVGHPAPFPEELPYRLIQLYSYKEDVILDPFCGSGTTCVVADTAGRRYVGYDNVPEYVALARDRLKKKML